MKISVIIPVFNAEKHIATCWAALVQQSFSDFEVIFVNDGSTDQTESLLMQLQSSSEKVSFFNQINQGVSAARNQGLKLAKGEFVSFMDVDDDLSPDFFETLLEAAESYYCDIVFSGFKREIKGKMHVEIPFTLCNIRLNEAQIFQKVIPEFVRSNRLNSVCNKLFRRSILDDVCFPLGMALGEDGVFCRQAVQKAKALVVLEYCGYIYKETIGSATRDVKKHNYFQAAINDCEAPTGLESIPNYDALRAEKLINQVLMCVGIYTQSKNGLSLKDQWKLLGEMLSHPRVQWAFSEVPPTFWSSKSGFKLHLLRYIKNQQRLRLFLALQYTHFKNKN